MEATAAPDIDAHLAGAPTGAGPGADRAVEGPNTRAARAPRVENPRLRRMLAFELAIVLTIFPLPSTVVAIYMMFLHMAQGYVTSGAFLVPNEAALTVLLSVLSRASELSAAALVLYLLMRSGEGSGSIGLDSRQLRRDLALVLPVWFVVEVIPQHVGTFLLTNAHLSAFNPIERPEPAALLIGLVASVVAGVLEEIVVLGYLVRRLEQQGWASASIVVVAVAVRVSYHLYYGPGVLPIAIWATVTVLVYRRIRRLAPFIICHIMWDARIFIAQQSTAWANAAMLLFLATAVCMCIRWRKWQAPQVV